MLWGGTAKQPALTDYIFTFHVFALSYIGDIPDRLFLRSVKFDMLLVQRVDIAMTVLSFIIGIRTMSCLLITSGSALP